MANLEQMRRNGKVLSFLLLANAFDTGWGTPVPRWKPFRDADVNHCERAIIKVGPSNLQLDSCHCHIMKVDVKIVGAVFFAEEN